MERLIVVQTSQRVEDLSIGELQRRGAALRASRTATDPRGAPIVAAASARAPASSQQQQIWLFDQLTAAGALFNLSVVIRLRGPLRFAALERAIREVLRRHETLRARFEVENGHLMQVTEAVPTVVLERPHLSSSNGEERWDEIQRSIRVERERVMDLRRGPLFRAVLLTMSESDHVLHLTAHHLIFDLSSRALLLKEIGALYGTYADEQPSQLAACEIQYADYARWQESWLNGAAIEDRLAYWRSKMQDAPEALQLPTDRPRPEKLSFRGASVPLPLGLQLSEELRAQARREEVTLYMMLLAAFQIVLSRWSDQRDIVVACPVAGRNHRQIQDMIGSFARILPLRTLLSGHMTIRELLQQIKETTLEAYANQDLPLSRLMAVLTPARDLSRHPICQVSLHFQNAPQTEVAFSGLTVESLDSPELYSNFDLTLGVWPTSAGLQGAINYSADLFEEATVARLASHVGVVLAQLVSDTRMHIDELELLGPAERHRLLVDWNDTAAEYSERCVHQLFEAQVLLNPEATAVTCESGSLTYRDLNVRANQLAHYLRSCGVRTDNLVAVCAERSLELMMGLLAVLKAGAAYLPLDPDYPTERLAFVVRDSGPVLLLTHGAADGAIQAVVAELGERVPVLDLAADAWRWKEQSVSNPTAMDVGLTPRDLAYVIYTSGSTGMPKGVMVEHRSVVNLLTWSQERCPLRSQDKLLQRTPISFDASVWELFWPVGVGAQLVMAPLGIDRDPARLVELVRDTGITIAQFVPAILESFVTHAKAAGSCAGLRSVFCGGGELSATLARRFREHLGSALLYNVYGPTETCVDATAWMCGAGPEGADVVTTRIPIGRPIANTYTYLLDERLRPVPQGAVGEIYIGGAGLARGYLRRPDLTAQRFIANPFVAGDRLYKSGDLGRYRADGHIEFFGRNDFQVKIRGFRIELGEIEVRLTQHPQVRDAVVVARMQADEPGEERLVAYYTPTQPDQEVDALSLRMHLSATLPQYMVPAAYVRLEALPLTPNGKLDAQALPAPSGVAYGRHGYEPPVGPVEAALAAIWVEVLGLERISRHDNFFYLGGHSLLAMRVVSRIREELHAEVSLVEVFTHPTLLQLARTVEQHSGAALPPVTPVVRSQLMAPSFAQQRPWFLAQTASGSQAYHMTQDFRLNGALDEAALRRALDRLVARHESLRTTFVPVDGAGFQCIGSPDIGFALALDDLTGLTNSKTQLERLIDTEGMAVFDLQTGPLIRGRLIRLSSREHVLLITMHHMISDGWSVGVLVRELSALYSAYRAGEPDPLPPLAVQYADYAAWQRQWLSGEVLATQCAYWRQTLAQTPVLLDLPTDRKRPPRQDYTAGCVPFELDVQLSADLNAASRRHGMTVFMILLAGWAVVLSRMSGQKDVVIGSPTANRRRVELEGLIGFFVNTLALRVDLTGDPTIEELLRRVKAAALGAQEHQDLPFEQVVELLAPVRSAAHTPLFQVMFAWQNNKKDSLQLPGLEVEPLDSGYFVAKFDLTLHAWPSGKCIVGGLEYATALFDRETAERYVGYLRMALVSIARSTGLLVAAIPLLSQQERDRLLTPHPQHTPAQHDHRCIHELFEAQVERAPGAVAVIHEDRCLTYGELNVQANRVAHALIARGIGPEDLVGLAVSRSLDMLVGLLGILKAGGAYVPLDPEYPAQRLTFMLEDAQPAVVITSVSGIGSLPVGIVDLLILDESSLELAACASHNPGVMAHRQPLTEQTPAYVIYTSGSTGMPKGVVLPHRVLHNLIAWQECTSRGLRGRVVAQLAPLSFDVSLQETLLALTTGMTLHIPDQTTRRDPVALIGWLERNAINALFAPNSLIETLCAAAMDSGASLQALNVIFQAGEPLCLSSSVRAFFSRPGRRLHNHYGPTETHVATAHELADDPSQWPALAPIGQPIANTRIYLLDERLQPVPQGAVGEIYIGGAGVARGYLRRPDLTAQRFIASPFVEGDRLYDSGDLGRYRADGHLEFLGRNDFQVKIRGFRIELGEIEARLAQHAQVREAVIAARADEPGDERLVAYYTTRQPEEGVDTLSLRTYLSAALPEYMVPAAYVRLETLPLTPNGKLDRNALPAPNGAAYGRQEHEPPVGPIETALAAIWTAVLGLETLSRHDNFFHLGGHSLLAVRVVSRIRQELNAEVPLAALFDHPTVVELAQYLPQTNSAPRTLPRPPISPDHS